MSRATQFKDFSEPQPRQHERHNLQHRTNKESVKIIMRNKEYEKTIALNKEYEKTTMLRYLRIFSVIFFASCFCGFLFTFSSDYQDQLARYAHNYSLKQRDNVGQVQLPLKDFEDVGGSYDSTLPHRDSTPPHHDSAYAHHDSTYIHYNHASSLQSSQSSPSSQSSQSSQPQYTLPSPAFIPTTDSHPQQTTNQYLIRNAEILPPRPQTTRIIATKPTASEIEFEPRAIITTQIEFEPREIIPTETKFEPAKSEFGFEKHPICQSFQTSTISPFDLTTPTQTSTQDEDNEETITLIKAMPSTLDFTIRIASFGTFCLSTLLGYHSFFVAR